MGTSGNTIESGLIMVLIKEPIIHTDKEFIATKMNEDSNDRTTKIR